MNNEDREYYTSVATIGIESHAEEMFLRALAEEDHGGKDPQTYLSALFWTAQELHEDFRWCGSTTCGEKLLPATTVRHIRNCPNLTLRSTYSTAPVESCFKCGAATITTEEYYARAALNKEWGCKTHVRHMRARLAVERAYPARKKNEPFGEGPAPDVEVVPVGGGKKSRARKPKSGPMH